MGGVGVRVNAGLGVREVLLEYSRGLAGLRLRGGFGLLVFWAAGGVERDVRRLGLRGVIGEL